MVIMRKSCDHIWLQQGSVKNLLEQKDASSDIFHRAVFCLNAPVWHRVQEIARTDFQSIKSEKKAVDFRSIFSVSD